MNIHTKEPLLWPIHLREVKRVAITLEPLDRYTQLWSPSQGANQAAGIVRTLTIMTSMHFTVQTTKFMVNHCLNSVAHSRPFHGRNGVHRQGNRTDPQFPGKWPRRRGTWTHRSAGPHPLPHCTEPSDTSPSPSESCPRLWKSESPEHALLTGFEKAHRPWFFAVSFYLSFYPGRDKKPLSEDMMSSETLYKDLST